MSEVTERVVELSIGPQHPGSGHMRFVVRLDGDVMVDVDPDIGYVHRAVEKIAETKAYLQVIPLVERPALADTVHPNLGYVLAVEKLLGIEAPPRAQYIRTLMAEISRIMSHLYGFGIAAIMIGNSTMFMWAFADREPLIELNQALTGARLTYSFIIPGGVRRDVPADLPERVEKVLRYIERRLKEYWDLFFNNPVVRKRYEGVGVMTKEQAIKWGATGPNLRASGVKYDARKVFPYAAYPELDFEVKWREEGDCYARMLVRLDEIRESMKIIRQVVKNMPDGPIFSEELAKRFPPKYRAALKNGLVKFPSSMFVLRPKPGKALSVVEGGRGEFLFYLVSKGDRKPYRMRMVTPSFRNLMCLRNLQRGHRLADLSAIYGSLDYFPPEADR